MKHPIRSLFWSTDLPKQFCSLVLLVAGCGDGGPQLAPVSGTVTFQGKPLAEAGITFAPVNARPAFGRVQGGQIVEVMTSQPGDGVIVGPVRVGIQATTNLGKITGPHRPLIPQRYFDPVTSGLTVDVTADGPNEFEFELTE